MSFYFDTKGRQLLQLQKRLQEDPASWTREGLSELDAIEQEIVKDVTICTVLEGFPKDLATEVHRTVLRYASSCQPSSGTPPEYDDPEDHLRGILSMTSDLHDLFHDVARRELAGFSDDPLLPIRTLYSRGEEVRERILDAMKGTHDGKDRRGNGDGA